MTQLADRQCATCEAGDQKFDADAARDLLKSLGDNWQLNDDASAITGEFSFSNYYETSAFVNAVVWICHQQDHHPEISFGYKNCRIEYSTHSVGGLSEKDFICAAKIDRTLST